MREEPNPDDSLQDMNIELEKGFRIVKSCPLCHSTAVSRQKFKGNYRCNNCDRCFKDPVFKQIKDRRYELPIPPTLLRKKKMTVQADKVNR
jgi:ribosomal protein L37AE/L43A